MFLKDVKNEVDVEKEGTSKLIRVILIKRS